MGCAEVSTQLQARARQFLCHIRHVSVVLHPARRIPRPTLAKWRPATPTTGLASALAYPRMDPGPRQPISVGFSPSLSTGESRSVSPSRSLTTDPSPRWQFSWGFPCSEGSSSGEHRGISSAGFALRRSQGERSESLLRWCDHFWWQRSCRRYSPMTTCGVDTTVWSAQSLCVDRPAGI